MATAKEIETAPSLPPASIDFNKLHDTIKAGKPAEHALDAAVIPFVGDEPEADAKPAADTKAPATAS